MCYESEWFPFNQKDNTIRSFDRERIRVPKKVDPLSGFISGTLQTVRVFDGFSELIPTGRRYETGARPRDSGTSRSGRNAFFFFFFYTLQRIPQPLRRPTRPTDDIAASSRTAPGPGGGTRDAPNVIETRVPACAHAHTRGVSSTRSVGPFVAPTRRDAGRGRDDDYGPPQMLPRG